MKRIISLIGLCAVLCLLGWTSLDAQRSAKYTAQATALKQELQEAQKLRQPKTALERAQSLMRLAETNRHFSDLVFALMASREANRSIDTERETEIFAALARVAKLIWLRPDERSLLSAVTYALYQDHYYQNRFYSRRSAVEEGEAYDPIDPTRWSDSLYRRKLEALEQEALGERRVLHQPMRHQLPSSVLRGESKWSGTVGSYVYRLLLYRSLEHRPFVLESLSAYVKELPIVADRLHADYFLLQHQRSEENERALYGQFLDTYAGELEVMQYITDISQKLYGPNEPRRAVELVDRYLQRFGSKVSADLVRSIKNYRASLLEASLSYEVGANIVTGHRVQTLRLNHKLLDSVRLRLYHAPSVLLNLDERYDPKQLNLELERTIALVPDSLWGSRSDTLRLEHRHRGLHYLHIEPVRSPQASSLRKVYHSDRYLRYYVTDQFVINHNNQGHRVEHLQWLDAGSGRPLVALAVEMKEQRGGERQSVQTDEQGCMRLPALSEGHWYANLFVRSMNPEDPLGLSVGLSRPYREDRMGQKSQVEVLLSTDRPVYRPADTLRLWGYLAEQKAHAELARVMPEEDIELVLYDANSERINSARVTTDSLGRFDERFALPREAKLGWYRIICKRGGRYITSSSLLVEEYRKPTFEVKMTKEERLLRLGDSIELSLRVVDMTGLPLPSVRLLPKVQIAGRAYQPRFGYFITMSREQEELDLPELVTDAEGSATLRLRLSRLKAFDKLDSAVEIYQHYQVGVQATATTGEVQRGEIRFSIGKDLPQITAQLPQYIEANQPKQILEVRVQNSDYEDVPYLATYEIYNGQKVWLTDTCSSNTEHNLAGRLLPLPSGAYDLKTRITLEDGRELCDTTSFVLYRAIERTVETKGAPLVATAPELTYSSQRPPLIYYASALEDSYIHYRTEVDGRIIGYGMLRPRPSALNQLRIDLPQETTEQVRVYLYTVRSARLYEQTFTFDRVQPDKELKLSWQSFRDRLRSGSKETWELRILHKGKPVCASVAAWMYDSALDAVMPLRFSRLRAHPLLSPFSANAHPLTIDRFAPNAIAQMNWRETESESYDSWYQPFAPLGRMQEEYAGGDAVLFEEASVSMKTATGALPMRAQELRSMVVRDSHEVANDVADAPKIEGGLRQDFAETAFFRPRMLTDKDGVVSWSFQLPDNLTRWRLELVAHTADMNTGYQTAYIESYRELMLKPYLPRLIRLGDKLSLAAQVQNLSDREQRGTVRLELFRLQDQAIIHQDSLPLEVARAETQDLRFSVTLDQSLELDSIGVRMMAHGSSFADGEQRTLPIVSPREEAVRSEAFTLLTAEQTKVDLSTLFPSTGFIPDRGRLEVRVESNPLFLALQTLPTLARDNLANSISISSALYGQALAKSIAQTPGLQHWIAERRAQRGVSLRDDRDSLLKRPLSTTPWAKAVAEEDENKRLASLVAFFDTLGQSDREQRLLRELAELQGSDGLWPWFAHMRGSLYTTTYVMRQLVRLRQLNPSSVDTRRTELMLQKGHQALDRAMAELMQQIQEAERKSKQINGQISSLELNYLYILELNKRAKSESNAPQRRFFLERLRRGAHELPLWAKPQAAVILAQYDRPLALLLVESLRQHMSDAEVGAFFAQISSSGYWWANRSYSIVTETIEALRLLAPEDKATLRALQQWLLNQKRSVRWESTTATAEALYALFVGAGSTDLREPNRTALTLKRADGTELTQSGERIRLVEHFDRESYPRVIEARAQHSGQVWGTATARYMLPSVEERASGREIQIERRHYLKAVQGGVEQLIPLSTGQRLAVGDVLVTKLMLKLSREMDFVALSDPRLGCAEPVRQTSGYEWRSGASYYYEPRDLMTNFYFDRLGRGEYQIEYEQYVVRSGIYQATSASALSVYAPEYTATSGFGGRLEVAERKR
ncbi:MAG: alpha-2-macroglobulin family protein [Porphyromonadaceae bacterium]|nr:alpha-2-macroglobulin family protein [Porphyromonadaceae bacterium]